MYLFFDTETTGLSRSVDHIVQLAWALTDGRGHVISEASFVIRPDGFTIPKQSADIHGITTTHAHQVGKPLKEVLTRFSRAASESQAIVAHNLSFDVAFLRSECKRASIPFTLDGKTQVCTMRLSTEWCRLPKLNGMPGFKYPKLEELHYRLFGEYFDGAHDAGNDVIACRRCYFALVGKGVISKPLISHCSQAEPIPSTPDASQEEVHIREQLNDAVREPMEPFPPRPSTRSGVPVSTSTIRLDELRSIAPDALVRPDDNETFGADLISAMAEIAKNEISEKQLGSSIVAANYSQYFEVWGEDLVDLMRRIALSVAFPCNEPLSTQSDEDVWGIDLLSFLARVSLREEAKLQGRHSGPDIEEILDESSKSATIAEDPLSTPEQLAELSKHPSDDVRMNVAANSKTPISALESLSKDASHYVRQCVAQNNNVTESILECLALDEMSKVRELVASNRNCPPSLFERFATDASGNVRMSAGANSNCSTKALRIFAASQFYEYRALAARHGRCPLDVMENLAKDLNPVVRAALLNNPSCPLEIRSPLYVAEPKLYRPGSDNFRTPAQHWTESEKEMNIYYWPNNEWCYEDELYCMTGLSEDYTLLDVGDKNWEEIDQLVTELNGGVYVPLL